MSRAEINSIGSGCYAVAGELDMKSVSRLWRESGQFFNAANESLIFDLQAVTRSDSAGVALLVEWMAQAREKGIDIRFRHLPEQMLEIARVSDLEEVIPLEG